MFSSSEFVEEWNQIFSFKIKENDLAKPTETFVFNALINYLKMFNFDTAPMIKMKNNENSIERRWFLVRFCNYIDRIYKISDKSHCFYFYDLQHPAPKKTVHMLNHLLNYLFYWNMFKGSIIPLASGKIRQMKELIDKINKYKYENKQIEINAKIIEKRIEDYRSLIPQTSAELQELMEAEAAEKHNINALEEKLTNCNSSLEALRAQVASLNMQIVSQEEVDSLLKKKRTLTNEIAEQDNLESVTSAKNQEHTCRVDKLQGIMDSIDKAMDLNPPTWLSKHNECNAKCEDLKSNLSEVNNKKDSLIQFQKKSLQDLKRLVKESSSKVQLLKEIKIVGEKEIERIKVLSESNEASIGDFEHELHTTERLVEEEKIISHYILENTAALVKATMKNCSFNGKEEAIKEETV